MLTSAHREQFGDERGTTALLVASALVVLMGMAAVAIDLGAGFNERRQDQIAADVGVMAGTLEALSGVGDMRDEALTIARANLPTQYSDAEWQTLWQSCTDPNRNDGGFNFQSVPGPAAWGGGTLDCISVDPGGFLRVRLPDQSVPGTFSRVLGVNELVTSAAAIGRFGPTGEGGILPFGVLAGAGGGTYCLAVQSGGTAQPPCEGGQTGNFGTIESPKYGNDAIGTTTSCNAAGSSGPLTTNLAIGLDHFVTIDPDGSSANHVLDQCYNFGVDTLFARQGTSSQAGALMDGLVSGPVDDGFTPRLQQGSNAKRDIYGWDLDNVPLWSYLLPNNTELVPDDPSTPSVDESVDLVYGVNAPMSCLPANVNDWEDMEQCLQDYQVGAAGYVQMFNATMSGSPRFAYVPQFWESDWPPGNSEARHIRQFRAVFLDGIWLGQGSNQQAFRPGDPSGNFSGGGNPQLRQVTGFLIPDNALPSVLRGDPPPWASGLNPYQVSLYR
jgi:hypothetical protein